MRYLITLLACLGVVLSLAVVPASAATMADNCSGCNCAAIYTTYGYCGDFPCDDYHELKERTLLSHKCCDGYSCCSWKETDCIQKDYCGGVESTVKGCSEPIGSSSRESMFAHRDRSRYHA